MFRSIRKHKQLAAAVAVVALAVPATSAAYASVDLRNPDSQAAAIEAQSKERGYVDLRSPDAKDAGQVAQSPQPPEIAQAPSFDWGDAGIGAGSVLGLGLIMLSVTFAVAHRRNRRVNGPGGPAVTT